MKRYISKIKKIIDRKIRYCDIGARWGIGEPWNAYRELIDLIGFEPDIEEFNKLNKKANDLFYNIALSDQNEDITLNLTKSRGCSSIFEPNTNFLNNFSDSDRFAVEKKISVKTNSLDELYKNKRIHDIDFIKIDTQGAELKILKGGKNILAKKILGIEVEVEFNPIYYRQPLFSDIDTFIRNNMGLQIQDIRKTYWKYSNGVGIGNKKGTLIFGDALYFRSPEKIISWCSDIKKNEAKEKLNMACLMGFIYGYLDYCLCLIEQPSIKEYLNEKQINDWIDLIHNYAKTFQYQNKGAIKISNFFNLLFRMFQYSHKGWATDGHHLGSRKRLGIFT